MTTVLIFGDEGAWNMMTLCRYLVAEEHHRMAI